MLQSVGNAIFVRKRMKILNSKVYKDIQSEVKETLAKEESSVYDLVESSRFPEKKLMEVIRVMMDNDEVKTSANNKIRLA